MDSRTVSARSSTRDYTLPEGCPACSADLPVRVTARGPVGVCRHCGCISRPMVRVTARGLEVEIQGVAA